MKPSPLPFPASTVHFQGALPDDLLLQLADEATKKFWLQVELLLQDRLEALVPHFTLETYPALAKRITAVHLVGGQVYELWLDMEGLDYGTGQYLLSYDTTTRVSFYQNSVTFHIG